MTTKLHKNRRQIEDRRQLWLDKDEWEIADTLSTQALIDTLIARMPDMDDSQWTELHDELVSHL